MFESEQWLIEPWNVFSPLVNGNKRAHDSDDDVIEQPVPQKPRVEKEIIFIDSPPSAPPPEEKPVEGLSDSNGATVEGVDDDLIVKFSKLNKEEQWIKLAQSAQQLRNLRDNVCKLLRVLVPEIELGDKSEILDDTTIDNLLKQVLEANVSPDAAQGTWGLPRMPLSLGTNFLFPLFLLTQYKSTDTF